MADVLLQVKDRRKRARRATLGTALIRFGDTSVCCAVRNLSESGAALDVEARTYLHDRFMLIIPAGEIYSCTLIWRQRERVGVLFS